MRTHPSCRSIFSFLFLLCFNPALAQAQIIPDGTLPTSVQQLDNMRNITGGEKVGDNLFHSFEEFSVPSGMEAIFNNDPSVQNIFTRVTGGEISTIDGLLQAQGEANLFLMNSNGIVFGENAVLDIGGSFIATTADDIKFADGTEFSAREPKIKLTISVPIGLGLLGDNGSITVNGKGNQITNDSSFVPVEFGQTPQGLSANNGRTLALVGNGLTFNGGVVTAEGGDIYLTSVKSGSVGIDQTESGIALGVNNVTQYEDINLNQQSLIDVSGEKVGSVFANGQNINLSDASFVLAQNQGNFSDGSINIKASETLTLSGNSPNGIIDSVIRAETLNSGKGANINIGANQIEVKDFGSIQTGTFGSGKSGDLNIKVSNNIDLSKAAISSATFGEGNAGNINLSTSQLKMSDVSIVTSSTFATGDGGEVHINSDLIEVVGTVAESGDITNISSSSVNTGNAGNIFIRTNQLRLINGGSISSSSFNDGNAGTLTIKALEFIEVLGTNDQDHSRQSNIRTSVQASTLPRRRQFGLPEVPTGNAGSLSLKTPVLNIAQEGVITVENQGTGAAGKLTITADKIDLDESGSINATAKSGQGGDIFLTTKNLQIGEGSQVTAEAKKDGDGGNITINTANLIAKKNSLVKANAFGGDGGNILVNPEGLFLFAPQEIIFDASSKFGIDGTVTINAPDNNFRTDLELSELRTVALSNFYTPRCQNPDRVRIRRDSGKYPTEDPNNYLNIPITKSEDLSPSLKTKLERLERELESDPELEKESNILWQPEEPIVNATELIKTEDGQLFLVKPTKKPSDRLACGENHILN